MIIIGEINLKDDEIELFKSECSHYDYCKLFLHYTYPDGCNTYHQFIYELDGKLHNFVFIKDKDNKTLLYRNSLDEFYYSKDTLVLKSMERVVPEIKNISELNNK
jgi:very-short-patch-repair endonuclease